MRVLSLIIFFQIGVGLFPLLVDARSGCCSHHGGVCGCGCCDGSSLSATCAPYYPSCNSEPVEAAPVQKLVPLPSKATTTPTTQTTPVNSKTNSVQSPQIIPVSSSSTEEDSSFGMGTILSILGAGALGWYLKKKQ